MLELRARFRDEFDLYRSAIVNEPRGSDVIVGALLLPPVDPGSATGVVFFNNTGYLGMCGHGIIGVMGHAGLSWSDPNRSPSDRDAGRLSHRHATYAWPRQR
jgi:proline racemase